MLIPSVIECLIKIIFGPGGGQKRGKKRIVHPAEKGIWGSIGKSWTTSCILVVVAAIGS